MSDPLEARRAFLREIGKLRGVERASTVPGLGRHENSAEHSWHLAMYALVLAADAPPDVDIDRVIRMLLIHDIVEIDAGDAPLHGGGDDAAQAEAEARAADRLFGILPTDQGAALHALWTEFEAGETVDARFARALDRAQPVELNLEENGGSWAAYDVSEGQIEARVLSKVQRGYPALAERLRGAVRAYFARS
ncbi:MAG: HD domain-containing protein [Rubricella sp.]